MLPVSEAKRNRAAQGGAAHAPGSTKSVVEALATVPVGSPPGIVIVCGLVLSTTGAPPTSPLISCAMLVPLLAIQNGLLLDMEMPHGLTNSGSSTGAKPGISESKVVS